MKKLTIIIMILLSFLCYSKPKSDDTKVKLYSMTFTEKNTYSDTFFSVNGEIDTSMSERFTRDIMRSDKKTYTLFFDSPGGSVLALNRMIETMDSVDKKFVCVSRYAASAAFMLFQHCDIRLMTPFSGILMSHNASMTVFGDVEKIKNMMKALDKIMDRVDKRIANRMGITLKEYKNLIANDLYLDVNLAVSHNAIDGVARKVKCTRELIDKTHTIVERKCSLFGCSTKKVKYSMCPLLTQPLPEEEKK